MNPLNVESAIKVDDNIFLRWSDIAKKVNNQFRVYFGQEISEVNFELESFKDCVRRALKSVSDRRFDAEDSWENWKKERFSQGWKWGKQYDQKRKIHPNLCEYYQHLPFEEKVKDYIYHAVILTLVSEYGEEKVQEALK